MAVLKIRIAKKGFALKNQKPDFALALKTSAALIVAIFAYFKP